jgi:hypothetical protein
LGEEMSFFLGCIFSSIILCTLNWFYFELSATVGRKKYTFSFVGMKLSSEDTTPVATDEVDCIQNSNNTEMTKKMDSTVHRDSGVMDTTRNEMNAQSLSELNQAGSENLETDSTGWEKKNLSLEIIEKIDSAGMSQFVNSALTL